MTHITLNKSLTAALVILFVFVIQTLTRIDNFELLFADDFLTVGSAVVKGCQPTRFFPLTNCLILNTTGSLTAIKVFYLVLTAISAAIAYLMALKFGMKNHLAALVAAVAFISPGLIPVGVFVTGSYPAFGLLFLIPALYFAVESISLQTGPGFLSAKTGFHWQTLASICLFCLAPLAGSANMGGSLSVLPMALLLLVTRQPLRTVLWSLAIALVPVAIWGYLQFGGVFANHYVAKEGWIDFSPAMLWRKASGTFTYLRSATSIFYTITLFSIVVIAVVYTAFCWLTLICRQQEVLNHDSHQQKLIQTCMLSGLLALSFLVFFPSLTVFHEAMRYLALPLVIITLAGCLVTASLTEIISPRLTVFLVPVFVFIAGYSAYLTFVRQSQGGYMVLRESQKEVRRFLDSHRHEFANNAQLAIELKDGLAVGTNGYNHWSTHFFRYQLNRPDVIGMIGETSRIKENPFTGDYSDHHSKYWTVKDGRSYRRQMVGLELGRPTYIYQLGKGSYRQLDCIAVREGSNWLLYSDEGNGIAKQQELPLAGPFGLSVSDFDECLHVIDVEHSTQEYGPDTPTAFTGNPEHVQFVLSSQVIPVKLSFALKSKAREDTRYTYSDTSPPMPMLSKGFTVYQVSDSAYRIHVSCVEANAITVSGARDWLSFEWEVDSSGNGILSVNGERIETLAGCDPPGNITLGKGYKERLWVGEIAQFSISQKE